MPRLSNTVPKYRKHKPSGQAIVTLGSRMFYLGPHGTKASRIEYDRLIAEWLHTGRSSLFGAEPDAHTVADLILLFMRYAKRRYQKNGRQTSEYAACRSAFRPLRRLYGSTLAAEFGPIALRVVRDEMIGADLARGTINSNVDRIKRMFRWAVANQLIAPGTGEALNAVAGLRAGEDGARETAPIKPVSDADVEAMLPHLPDVVRDMVKFQRATGARPEEVCSIRPGDVDTGGEVWRYVPGSHKTEHCGKFRTIFIGPVGQAILRPYLLRASDACCFSPADSERKRLAALHADRQTPLSCGNVPGSNRVRHRKRQPRDYYDTAAYRRCIHRACDRAGIPRWSPNRLRHAVATEIRAKHGIEAVRTVLGHSSTRTSEVYAERDERLAARIIGEVG